VNPLYLETLRRRRLQFAMIVIAAVASATWVSVGGPKMYRSAVTLWSDTPGAADQQLTGATPPAGQEQSTLNELLTTRYFRDHVARGGPLRAYLESQAVEGWGPTAILARLRGTGALDARIEGALGPKRVTSVVLGPHVLQIRYDAPSPALATATLRVLVREYEAQRVALREASVSSYGQQLQDASKAVSAARKNLRRYVQAHPGKTGSSELKKLAAAERAAIHQLTAAADTLQSTSTVGFEPAAFEQTLRVIDPPTVPTAPTTGHKHVAIAMFAGLFAGLLVSALGVVALTKGTQLVRGSDATAPGPVVEEQRPAAGDGQPVELIERRTLSG
jgi:hypothetical protein